jgi:excisionase family DNA binding protein
MTADTAWLGTPEAAQRLGITQRTLYRLIDDGQIPAYKMGRVFRVKESDLDEFLERSRVEPGSLRHLYPEPKGSAAGGDDL